MEKKSEKHTVVCTAGSLDSFLCSYLLRHVPLFQRAYGVVTDAGVKVISAGRLQIADWADVVGHQDPARLSREELEELGYIFVNCGGGQLDQHGKFAVLRQTMASVDLLVHHSGKRNDAEYAEFYRYLVDPVALNDLDGTDIIQDNECSTSAWPHTQRTLRNLVTGLSLSHPRQKEAVVWVMDVALTAALEWMRAEARRMTGQPNGTFADLTEAQRRFVGRCALLLPNISPALEDIADEATCQRFAREMAEAMNRMEADWRLSVDDYWNPRKTTGFSVLRRETDDSGFTTRVPTTVVCTISKTVRIGAVARRANWSKRGPDSRPFRNRESRRPADVVIIFDETNHRRFTVSSSKGIKLNDVARALRLADLVAKKILCANNVSILDRGGYEVLRQPGNATLTTSDGREHELLYFAEFETALGHLRSNPHDAASALTKRAVIEIVERSLSDDEPYRLAQDILTGRYAG